MKCKNCGFPDTRPGLFFENGVCGACVNYAKRKKIDWGQRAMELENVCAEYRGQAPYNCLIPVSGGKDSHRLVHIMKMEMGMSPLLVTVTDSFTHTKAGTHNLRNLITRYNCNHWQYTISHDLFIRATRAAFEGTGEALAFVEFAIYTIPFMLAQKLGIGLLVFGEHSGYEYGSKREDSPEAENEDMLSMATKIKKDAWWWQENGIAWEELSSILPVRFDSPRLIYMSRYVPWSSTTNLEIARANGFKTLSEIPEPDGIWKREGCIEDFEQIDSIAYLVHLWLKFPKFGFQRVTDIATRRLREGRITREECDKAIAENDHKLDSKALDDFCNTLGYTRKEFYDIVEKGWQIQQSREYHDISSKH